MPDLHETRSVDIGNFQKETFLEAQATGIDCCQVGIVSIIVPRRVYLDLADINTGEVTMKKGKFTLRLSGGDASESYRVVIEFDANRVRTKRVYSGESTDFCRRLCIIW